MTSATPAVSTRSSAARRADKVGFNWGRFFGRIPLHAALILLILIVSISINLLVGLWEKRLLARRGLR